VFHRFETRFGFLLFNFLLASHRGTLLKLRLLIINNLGKKTISANIVSIIQFIVSSQPLLNSNSDTVAALFVVSCTIMYGKLYFVLSLQVSYRYQVAFS